LIAQHEVECTISHRNSLRTGIIILGDVFTGDFVIVANESCRGAVNGGLYALAIAKVVLIPHGSY
jgi:hypothetical protein